MGEVAQDMAADDVDEEVLLDADVFKSFQQVWDADCLCFYSVPLEVPFDRIVDVDAQVFVFGYGFEW